MPLRTFLDAQKVMQAEIVRQLGWDSAKVNRLVNDPEANPTRETIDAILGALSEILGRQVTYEEAFGTKAA